MRKMTRKRSVKLDGPVKLKGKQSDQSAFANYINIIGTSSERKITG